MDPPAGGPRRGGARKFFAGVLGALSAYAAHQRTLARRLKDGATYRQHLERAAQAGSPAARRELEGPGLPPAGAYVWTWFLELAAARSGHGAGLNPVGFAEIEAWARLTGRRPAPWEIAALRALDGVWLAPEEKAGEPGT